MSSQALSDLITVLGAPFLACVAMTGILGYLGLHVLRREIVFVDIAMAQIVAVGTIAAHLFFDAHDDLLAYLCSFGLAAMAAAFFAITRRRIVEISAEAVIGVSYAIAAAAALFLLGVAPEGHIHAQHMLAGSILWATWTDVLICASAFAIAGLVFYILRRPFERISSDYHAAVRDGVRVVWWDFLFYLLIGVVITFAVRVGGVVVVFCLLVIPAIIAVMVSRSPISRLLVAWSAGVSGSLLGLLFADRLDFSVGPSVALLLGVGLVVVGAWFRLARVPAAGMTVVAVVAYVALLVTAPSRTAHNVQENRSVAEARDEPSAKPPLPDGGPDLSQTTSPAGFPALFDQTSGPQARCDVVLQALESDPDVGMSLALIFLQGDPPLYFRQVVVDRLDQVPGSPLGFDVTRPFADPVNRQAADRLRTRGGR